MTSIDSAFPALLCPPALSLLIADAREQVLRGPARPGHDMEAGRALLHRLCALTGSGADVMHPLGARHAEPEDAVQYGH